MNQTLDHFESALLAELRQHVADHPALDVGRRPRRRLRILAAAGTAAAASVVAVLGIGGPGGAPAFAVSENAEGDVIVTVHRLDDAEGLEAALHEKGLDVDVSYHGDAHELLDMLFPPQGASDEVEYEEYVAHTEACGLHPFVAGELEGLDFKGPVGPDERYPAELASVGDDVVLTIPADSMLQHQHFDIGANQHDWLAVSYTGTDGKPCGLLDPTATPITG